MNAYLAGLPKEDIILAITGGCRGSFPGIFNILSARAAVKAGRKLRKLGKPRPVKGVKGVKVVKDKVSRLSGLKAGSSSA